LPDTGTWEQIFNESYEQTKQALMDEKNVLYDSTNQTVASRNKLREIADSVDSDTKVLFVRSPIETVWQRWSENQKNPSRSVVSKDLVQQTIHMFEEPTEEENVIMVDN
jgi:predicted kinase